MRQFWIPDVLSKECRPQIAAGYLTTTHYFGVIRCGL